MSHHFDSPAARADSRINISDIYLFAGGTPDTLTAIVAVSPLAGLPSPYHDGLQWRTFRPDTAYDLRFDTDGDLAADVVVRAEFSGGDVDGGELGAQQLTLSLPAEPDVAPSGGRTLVSGPVGETLPLEGGGRVWTGEAGDAFWLDAVGAAQFIAALKGGAPFRPDEFSTGTSTTAATNTLAIVVELPLDLVSRGPMAFWATVAAQDHGRWTQVVRCGRPNFAATFVDDPERSTAHNDTAPAEDLELFAPDVETVVEQLTRVAGTAEDPAGYARLAARALLPDVIPYDPALPASFGFAGVNGRGLRDDFGSVVYSVVFNHPMRSAVAPLADLRDGWPWLPPPRPLPEGPGVAVPSRQEA